MSYHVNNEGKIYPCTATVKKCKYGEGRHSERKEDLYHMSVVLSNTVEPSRALQNEVSRKKYITNLSSLSEELETHKAPVEFIVSSLHDVIIAMEVKRDFELKEYKNKTDYHRYKTVTYLSDLLRYNNPLSDQLENYSFPGGFMEGAFFPKFSKELQEEARARWKDKHKGITEDTSLLTNYWWENDDGDMFQQGTSENRDNLNQRLRKKAVDHRDDYVFYKNKVRDVESKWKERIDYAYKEFNHFSGLLNTSKIVSSRTLTDANMNNDGIIKAIQNLSNEELLNEFDNSTVSDEYVKSSFDEINQFTYTYRNDLSEKAQNNLIEWHKKSGRAACGYVLRSQNNARWGIEIRNELAQRGFLVDLALHNINLDRKKLSSLFED